MASLMTGFYTMVKTLQLQHDTHSALVTQQLTTFDYYHFSVREVKAWLQNRRKTTDLNRPIRSAKRTPAHCTFRFQAGRATKQPVASFLSK